MNSTVTARKSVHLEGETNITMIYDEADTELPFGIFLDEGSTRWFSESDIREFLTAVKDTFDL